MNFDSVDSFLRHVGVGRLSLDDPFFNDTHEACRVFRRTGITSEDDEDLCHRATEEFQCCAPHCDEIFRNLADYEIHYNGLHRYTCEECKITLSNARLLDIHIQETHDSFFEISSQKRSMYQCYVFECNEKFASPKERKRHCVTIHKYPESFRFDSGVSKKDQAVPAKVKRRGDAWTLAEYQTVITEPISAETSPICVGERLCALRHSHDNPSRGASFCESSESSSKFCEYIRCAHERSIDEKNIPSFIEKQDLAPEHKMFLPPRLDRNIYAMSLAQNVCAKKNILESNNLMDLLDQLPD